MVELYAEGITADLAGGFLHLENYNSVAEDSEMQLLTEILMAEVITLDDDM